MSAPRNPKDSMKSTWRTSDRKDWTHFHYTMEWLNLHPVALNKEVPVHQKDEKIPYVPEWQTTIYILWHAAVPLALQQAYVWYTGKNFNAFAALGVYTLAFILNGIHQVNLMRRLGHVFGFLDGDKHERDGVPDHSVGKIMLSLTSTVAFREVMAIYLSYDVTKAPIDMNWLLLPLEVGLYGVVLDFWFYWYHRVMHSNDELWKFHRTHHLTKHPNPLLTLYADETQEFFDIVGIPLLAYLSLKAMGLPMGYYEWWVCYQYVVFAELAGHSGLRIHSIPPNTFSPLLRLFNAELVIEDHDLHHRSGWKKSHNYGKQTRLWDRVFGTCADRIESQKPNIDYENQGTWPLF